MNRDLITVFSDCLLQIKWPFEQSNNTSKCIDTVHVKHKNYTITYHLSMNTEFVSTIFHQKHD